MRSQQLTSTHDLLASERKFVNAMTDLGFGSFEQIKISKGQLILVPWPSAIRHLKFGTPAPKEPHRDFLLKAAVKEFFEYVRGVDEGQVLTLVIRYGLPFSMEIEYRPADGGQHG